MSETQPVSEHEDLIEQFEDRLSVMKSEGTAERYKYSIRYWFRYLTDEGTDPFAVTEADLRVHLRGMLEDEYSVSMVKMRKNAVSAFYQELSDMKAEGEFDGPTVPDNPAEDMDLSGWKQLKVGTEKSQALRQDIHGISPEEKELLCEHVRDPPLRNELLIRLAWQTMLRRGELVQIRLTDIDRDERSINIRGDKVHLNREVYYQPSLDFLFDQWIDIHREAISKANGPFLFPTNRSEHLNDHTFNRIVQDAAEDSGIQEHLFTDHGGKEHMKYSCHSLRHGGAVQCIRNGMDVRTLSDILGHSKLSTTRQYLDLAQQDVRDKARRFGPGTERG